MALAPIGSWCFFGGRHCDRVLWKWRSFRTVSASYERRKSSQVPALVRYLPKESRKADGKNLECVHYPDKFSSTSEDIEQDYYNRDEFGNDLQEQKKKKKGRFYLDETEKQRSELGLASFRKQNLDRFKLEETNAPTTVSEAFVLEKASEEPWFSSRFHKEVARSSRESSHTRPEAFSSKEESCSKQEVLSTLKLVPASQLAQRTTTENLNSEHDRDGGSKFKLGCLVPASARSSFPKEDDLQQEAFCSSHVLEDESDEADNEDEDNPLAIDVQTKTGISAFPDSAGERSAAKNYAIFLLGKWQRTSAELRKKLHEKNYSVEVTESTIAALREEGLQSDSSYAEVFAQSRWSTRGWGPKRIKHELGRKGVDAANIDRAVQRVFRADESGNFSQSSDEMRWGMSRPAEEHLLALSARKWNAGGNISVEARNRRLAGWLQRRGFGWKVINGIISKLQGKNSSSYNEFEGEV